MKKYSLLLKIAIPVIAIAVFAVVSIVTNMWSAVKVQGEGPDAPVSDNMIIDSPLYLESDAPHKYYFRYDAGTVININYTVQSVYNADEYGITCSGEGITLLSPVEYKAGKNGSYALKFTAPESGEGKITLALAAPGGGTEQNVNTYLYWCSCDLGVFLSESSVSLPELGMAKTQYDAKEITSGDYYNVVRSQHFEVDMDLMNMLGRVCSDKIQYSGYAAPYVEAIHNSIFGIKSDKKVPDINETIKKIEADLGVKLGP